MRSKALELHAIRILQTQFPIKAENVVDVEQFLQFLSVEVHDRQTRYKLPHISLSCPYAFCLVVKNKERSTHQLSSEFQLECLNIQFDKYQLPADTSSFTHMSWELAPSREAVKKKPFHIYSKFTGWQLSGKSLHTGLKICWLDGCIVAHYQICGVLYVFWLGVLVLSNRNKHDKWNSW